MRQPATEPVQSIQTYHERTKHRLTGYARGPDMLDWDDQPDPFRRYEGAEVVELPISSIKPSSTYRSLWIPEASGQQIYQTNLASLSSLLELSLALSAWKQMGDSRWSMRCNPSSGNLHPTEAYVIACGLDGLPDGIYHYRADLHALEKRCAPPKAERSPCLLIGFSSVHWREAWKYGERSFRYCQHDVGHALAAVGFASKTIGWKANPISIGDDELSDLLGLNQAMPAKAEREHPDCLLALVTPEQPGIDTASIQTLIEQARQSEWSGEANILNKRHFYQWDLVDQAAHLTHRQEAVLKCHDLEEPAPQPYPSLPAALPASTEQSAQALIRQRRSAQGFDATTPITQDQLFETLDHLLPRTSAPWNCLTEAPHIHLLLFIHRVEGIEPGLYALPRTGETGLALLKEELKPEYQWLPVGNTPEHLPLYLLEAGKTQRFAVRLCCQQTIAGSSAFSLGMLAEFDRAIEQDPWHYRSLHWEAGSIGQALYLEAEAAGLRGTGIGCFLDDEVHELVGIQSTRLQTIYHFTVGTPLHDPRITTWPPYPNRKNSK